MWLCISSCHDEMMWKTTLPTDALGGIWYDHARKQKADLLVAQSKWCKSAKYAVNAITAEIEGSSRYETSIAKNIKPIGAKQIAESKAALVALIKESLCWRTSKARRNQTIHLGMQLMRKSTSWSIRRRWLSPTKRQLIMWTNVWRCISIESVSLSPRV